MALYRCLVKLPFETRICPPLKAGLYCLRLIDDPLEETTYAVIGADPASRDLLPSCLPGARPEVRPLAEVQR